MSDKGRLRQRAWAALRAAGAARFPGVEGRIPNFVGAEAAAALIAGTPEWKRAKVIKSNPDLPERPLRLLALRQGKLLYMAVPRLASARPFLALEPSRLDERERTFAASIKGAGAHGRPVGLDELEPIDLIVTGCVAVTREGARLGKGEGYSDLEYAMLRERGLVSARTTILSVVHPSQVLEDGAIPMTGHDISLDLFATPREVVRCSRRFPRPRGVDEAALPEEKRAAIPALATAAAPSGTARAGRGGRSSSPAGTRPARRRRPPR